MPTPFLNEQQVAQLNRHLASKGVNLVCPFCGHRYERPMFASVPAVVDYQSFDPPSGYTRPLVQVDCTNCAHVALFNVPIDPA